MTHTPISEATGTGTATPRSATLSAAYDALLSERGGRPALHFFGSTFTGADVDEHVRRVAAHWQEGGLVRGDRVLIQLQNVPAFVFCALAAWKLGAVIVPVSPMYRAREVRKILLDSGAVRWVTSPDVWARQGGESIEGTAVQGVLLARVSDLGAGLPAGIADAEAPGEPGPADALVTHFADLLSRPAPADVRWSDCAPSDLAALTYTSGTTGAPKGARTTHRNLSWVGHAYPAFSGVAGPDEVVIATAPLVHITGLAMHLASWLVEASELVLAYRFDPAVNIAEIRRHSVTWTTGTATAYIAMLAVLDKEPVDFPSLRFLGCGGAPVPTHVAERIMGAFGVHLGPGYGLTESTAAVTSTPPGTLSPVDPDSGIIGVGRPLFDTRIRIVDEDGTPLPLGERGEVAIAGHGVADGYWENPEATAAAFVDGWLRTGDVGFLDDDGELYIVDRTKNMIVASGYKVWPREVEDVIYAHELIREVAVVGMPDEYRGESIVAAVSLSDRGAGMTAEQVADVLGPYCRENLAAYKVPRRFLVRDELPKNFNGKIQHRDIRAEAER